MSVTQEDIQGMHCGLITATKEQVQNHMPAVAPVVDTCPRHNGYRFDVKVHMLMPGQWPCIPGWHCDFVPRDEENRLRPERIPNDPPPMFLWVSGHPLTEFRGRGVIEPRTWVWFTQRDEHRGRESQKHTWRLFIRAAHERILPPHTFDLPTRRRHAQVYLDRDFDW